MRLIGVLDLRDGRAVHARGGRREDYAPVRNVAGHPIDGDPLALASSYVTALGLSELYAADLAAITGGAPQREATRAVAALAPLWLDAGVSRAEEAQQAIADGAARVIVGLETLSSFDALARIAGALGPGQAVFSLDLWNGSAVARHLSQAQGLPPPAIAARAADSGAGALIVLDLARVGSDAGLDLDTLRRVRDAVPATLLIAGGGVRGLDDLAALAACGCDGALVASAIHDGRLGAAEVEAARRLQPNVSR